MNEINLSWAAVVTWSQTELDRLRKQNDSLEMDLVQTAALRGEIRALKRLIDLPAAAARKAQQALGEN